MTESYRGHFRTAGAGQAYDEGQYASGSYWQLIWALERPLLDRIAGELASRGQAESYLDFACGTGRILTCLEERFQTATGIDVSEDMLEQARRRTKRASLVHVDITTTDQAGERYDLITAFRFLLNAEPALRRAALQALAARLRGPESVLVLNTHGNPWSFKLLAMPAKWLRSRLSGLPGENYLSGAEVRRLLSQSGLQVVSVHGFGFLPWRFYAAIPGSVALATERVLSRIPIVARLGVNQVFVCKLRPR